jgi:hypothetical protein
MISLAPLLLAFLQQPATPGGPPIGSPPGAGTAAGAPPATTPAEPAPSTPAAPPPGANAAVEPDPGAGFGPPPSSFETQQSVRQPGSSLLNPAISVILDGYFGYYGARAGDFAAAGLPPAGDDPSPSAEGFGMQEVELAAQSAIDPYLEGALFLTIPNLQGIEVEEGYLVTTSLPLNLQFKAGSFRSQVGRNNNQHLHLQNFTRRPLMTALLFGADGLRGPGAQASLLLPFVPWFATLYLEGLGIGAANDTPQAQTFGGGGRGPGRLTATAVLEQYWDPSETTSILLGLNFATGRLLNCAGVVPCAPDAVPAPRSYLYGGDLYFKWKPPNEAISYSSLQWTTEFFARSVAEGGPTEGAGYTELVAQLARRWYLGGRFDLVGLPSGPNLPRRYGGAASLTFAASEFSRFRLYAQEIFGPGIPRSTVGFFQTEISMGAHGAHPF